MLLNIYKEKDWTSFDVVAKIRGILRKRRGTKKVKVGHAGTLDPLAEGVLVVLTDADTKKQDKFMNSDKEYYAEIAFGATTASHDLEQPVELSPNYKDLLQKDLINLESQIKSVLPEFTGNIHQIIPVFSAKKVKGKRLYKKARSQDFTKIETKTKEVTVYNIEFISVEYQQISQENQTYKFPVLKCSVTCSKGTYIRSLAYELGEKLGYGAFLSYLERTRVGDYFVEDSVKIENLKF